MSIRASFRLFFYILLLILGGVLGFYIARGIFNPIQEQKRESAEVLLEKIEKVAKLIAVEGHFSEIYEYNDFRYHDIAPLRKKALIRVHATVAAGYDLEGMSIEVHEDQKRIILPLPSEPTILSIDQRLSYYDIQEGVFNTFDEKDLTELQNRTRDVIRSKALESDLLETAREQGEDWIDMLKSLAEASGWTLEIRRGRSVEEWKRGNG